MIHLIYIYFIINSFCAGAIWMDNEYKDFGGFRWVALVFLFVVAGSLIFLYSWIKVVSVIAYEWLDDKLCLDFWLKYIFAPWATMNWTEDELWGVNYNEFSVKFRAMEKKTLQARIYLNGLNRLNKRNNYQP